MFDLYLGENYTYAAFLLNRKKSNNNNALKSGYYGINFICTSSYVQTGQRVFDWWHHV